ncbi:CubicO group peptidase (beta-lactamase class C family) [Nocardioides luteus]|uniref:serine hydrolase domain-containing protein n=1 Tax=Nocardioides luteus TaxID=1844 RepID=UPI00166A9B8C|nr:serine hydrolase domain-containing protein [Nocardioides luteus]MDR7310918.1 CubicO group peptidase (beta-lactamase class C family) [Nocardioides luteus]
MIRRLGALLAIVLVLVVPFAQPAAAEEGEAIAEAVADFAEKSGYPGIAVVVTEPDGNRHATTYGVDAEGDAVTSDTRMPVASVSKTMTAAAVMQLVAAGRVDLDAPVYDYLPDFRLEDRRGAEITVRHLLSQTSGITDLTLREKSLPQPSTLAEAERRARQAGLATDPGAKYAYTNTNFHLAARIVERVSGMPFGDYLERAIFEPAGMKRTTTIDVTPEDLPADVADGHLYAYGLTPPAAEPHRFVDGSDGVITTPDDLATWLLVQRRDGVAANGTRVLPAGTIEQMQTAGPDARYALGWEVGDRHGEQEVGHGGIWFTYTADVLLTESGHGVVVMGNSGVGLGNEGTGTLATSVADIIDGRAVEPMSPIRVWTDLVLAALTLLTTALGVRRLARTRSWVRKHGDKAGSRLTARLLPRLAPTVLLFGLPYLIGFLYGGGRDISLVQLAHFSPALMIWVTVAAVANLATIVVRILGLRRHRAGEPVPSSRRADTSTKERTPAATRAP